MPRTTATPGQTDIRRLREQLRLSQPQIAARLGVSAESYRAWDSGRRTVPKSWMEKARAFAAVEDPSRLWRLQDLAAELGVHVRTLRAAARSGRLDVTYENRVVFRNPIPKATLDASRTFMARFYRQSYSRFAVKPTMPPRTHVPQDCASKLLALRRRLQLSQAELAARVGAAGKAVVYQWESGKRRPSEIFWCRIETLLDL